MVGVTTLPKSTTAGVRAPGDSGILVVDDIVKRFETPDGVLTAVDHVSFTVAPGEFVSEKGKHNILGGTAARLFKLAPRNAKQRENLKRFGNLVTA